MKYRNTFLVLTLSALVQCGSVGWSQEGPITITDHEISVREGPGFTIRVETKLSESDDVKIGSFGFRTANRFDAGNVPPGFEIEGNEPSFARPKNRDLAAGFLDNGPRDEDSRKGVFVTTIKTNGWQPGQYPFLVTAHNRPAPGAYVGDARTFSIEVRADGNVVIPSVTMESNVAGRDVVLYKEEGVYAPFPSLYGVDDGEVLLSRFSRKATRKHIDERGYGSLTMLSRDGGLSWEETDRSVPVLPYIQTERGEWVQPAYEGWQRTDASERDRLEKMGRDVRDVREGQIAYLSPYYRIRRSLDQGASWKEERIRAPDYVKGMYGFFETHSGLVTSTGVRLRAIYGKANGSDQYEVFFLRSADDGKSWGFVRLQPEGPKEIGFGESSLIETASGRLLIVMRTDPPGELWQSFSDDGGETWSSPEKTGMWGYPPHLLNLPDGKLLCTYGYRRAPMGVRAAISEDNGNSWNVDSEFILRGDGRHNGSDLGYPTSVLLNDGSLFTSYYITLEDNITHIAGTRWRLAGDNGSSKFEEFGAAPVLRGSGVITPAEEANLRRKAATRPRRIIYNNDGGDGRVPSSPLTIETLLAARTTPLIGSQVDTIIYDTTAGTFGTFAHRTEVAEIFTTREGRYRNNVTPDLIKQGTDPLQVMLDFSREHEFEFFWTMRMNDTHDAGNSLLLSKFKKENPDLLFGSSRSRPARGGWSGVDYGEEKVRELAFRTIEEVAENYDVDGIHLDFFRHPVFFKRAAQGKRLRQEDLNVFTEWMSRVRGRLREIGAERGKPILLAIRVPDSVGYCREVGIDLERWLSGGLVDILVPSGYFRLNRWEYSVELGHRHGVMVYPCLSESRVGGGHNRDPDRRTLEAYRARAANVWESGADGVYLFNMFNPAHPMLQEIGSPETLAEKNKDYFINVRGGAGSANPLRYLPEAKDFFGIPVLTPDSPRILRPGSPLALDIDLGEKFAADAKPTVTLRLRIPDLSETEAVAARLNGHRLQGARLESPYVVFPVDAGWLRPGKNLVEVAAHREGTHSIRLRSEAPSGGDGVAFTEVDVTTPGSRALRLRMAAEGRGEGTVGSFSIRTPNKGDTDAVPPGFAQARNGYVYPEKWSTPGFLINGEHDEAPGRNEFGITLPMQGGKPGEYALQLIVHNRPNTGPYFRDDKLISFAIDEDGQVTLPRTLEDVQLRVRYGE